MGEGGVDIKDVSGKLPVAIECKNVERLDIYKALEQAEANASDVGVPCVVFKRNGTETYAALPWEDLLTLLTCFLENGGEIESVTTK
jgi:hypothetical protein